MATVSTEGRIFVAQLTRELAAHECAGAALLAPGTKRWGDAFSGFAHAIAKAKGPVHAAKMFKAGRARLATAQRQRACFVNGFACRSRSGAIEILTYEVAKHPLANQSHEGVLVKGHMCTLQRNGILTLGSSNIAYLGWHALARMHERSKIDIFAAGGVVVGCGLAGVLMRESDKHLNSQINYAVANENANMICTGILRHARKEDGRYYGFFDVLTVLPDDDPRKLSMLEQGIAVAHAVHKYVRSDDSDPNGYAVDIPVLRCRDDDYVSRFIAGKLEGSAA
jgi:hypothetical protein